MKTSHAFTRSLLAAAVTLTLPSLASAQQLEEVMVTATKRVESTQDIPMSVEAVTGEQLDALGIMDFAGLSDTIPNFFVADGVVTTNVNMRGMGSGGDRSFEQSVGMFIDDVYMPRSRQYRAPFFDSSRVEVLRGPQAVLFGLNSTAGAVAVHTRRSNPGEAFNADVKIAYETEYEGTLAAVALGGGIGDTLGVRFAGQFEDSDGYFKNNFTGKDEGDREASLYRLSAVWEPTDNLSIDAKYEYSDFEQTGSHGELFGPGAATYNNGDDKLNWERYVDSSLFGTFPRELSSANVTEPGLFTEIDTFALNIDYMVGDYTLTGIFGYSDTEYTFGLDLDSMAGGFFDPGSGVGFVDATVAPESYEQTSFEVQFKSPGGETIDYVLGFYYMESELDNEQPTIYGMQPLTDVFVGPGSCNGGLIPNLDLCNAAEYGSPKTSTDQDLWSAFAHLTWSLSDSFRVIGGLRYTDDEKDHDRETVCKIYDQATGTILFDGFLTCPTGDGFSDKRSSDNWMPEVVLQWDFSDDAMVYGKVANSAKSGGFAFSSSINPESLEYDDEEVIGYELGYKGRFGGGMAEFNAVLFYNDYSDLQSNSFVSDGVSTSSIIGNADATTAGLEVDGRFAATDWLVLGGSAAWLESEWDDFKDGPCNQSSGLDEPCDLTGETLAYAPELSATIFADVTIPVGSSMNLIGNVTAAYTDDYYTDTALDPVGEQDSFTRVNAQLGVEAEDGKWSLSVIGRNLTEEEVLNVTQPFLGLYLGYIGAPRTVAVQATYRFGE